jgi:hypothetical protein
MATLRMGRDYLNSQSLQQSRISRALENKMLDSTVALADLQLCPMSKLSSHLFRAMSVLWRCLICGDGEPDLIWANPASSIPLRVHSFATILHLVGTTSLYMAKCGVTQLDGTSKFNFVTLGRVLALLFDERKLFGQQAIEKFDEHHWFSPVMMGTASSSPVSKKSPPKRRGHIRQTYELGNDIVPAAATSIVSSFPSTAGDLATIVKPERTDLMGLPWNFEIEFETSRVTVVPPKPDVKLDTKSDFQSFLRAAEASYDEEISVSAPARTLQDAGVADSKALIQAYGGLTGGINRRYMTVPASLLPTILEQGDEAPQAADGHGAKQDSALSVSGHPQERVDSDNGQHVQPSSTKQMRRPRVTKGGSLDVETEKQLSSKETRSDVQVSLGRVLASEDDMKTMGDAFLDKLSGLNFASR